LKKSTQDQAKKQATHTKPKVQKQIIKRNNKALKTPHQSFKKYFLLKNQKKTKLSTPINNH
jgi:hypothetical protein